MSLKDFPPTSLFAFLLIFVFCFFFGIRETTANTSHLAVIAVR